MVKNVHIKLTRVAPNAGPFDIYDQDGNLIEGGVSRIQLMEGVHYMLASTVVAITIISTGDCSYEKTVFITAMTEDEFYETPTELTATSCLWRHLTDPQAYNKYYGAINPYVIEYPFSYTYHDQIVQNVRDFTRVYRYFSAQGAMYNTFSRIETDDEWFNKAILYNNQQCSGMLELVPKPKHNLNLYSSYPLYNTESKTIIFTKSDSFYNFNTFWDIMEDKTEPMFITTCESLSIDKVLNQWNMNYGYRSFIKAPLRAKDLRVRYILDDKGDIHLVSRFIYAPTQISYK